jgi:hypothetical protein
VGFGDAEWIVGHVGFERALGIERPECILGVVGFGLIRRRERVVGLDCARQLLSAMGFFSSMGFLGAVGIGSNGCTVRGRRCERALGIIERTNGMTGRLSGRPVI